MNDMQQPPEEIRVVEDRVAGLDGVIVLHSTTLGPAAGGCRLWGYVDQAASLEDACRLAEGMAYKNALAELPLGGGKAVLRRPEGPFDREALFRAFGRAVDACKERYITAEDVGTGVRDMQAVAQVSRFVAGLPAQPGRPGGDPSPWTARGVLLSMRLAAERRLHRPLSECSVAVQGLGHVGETLATMLHAEGCRLHVADINSAKVARVAVQTNALATSVRAIATAPVDIFTPCALGGAISEDTSRTIKAAVVCGAANNQLASPELAARLADRNILYAPDYVVNAGGIISVAGEYLGWSAEDVAQRVEETGIRLGRVLDQAAATGVHPHAAADALARQIIAGAHHRRAAA